MTETDNLTDNMTAEERDEHDNPPTESADPDATPGDLSGERTDADGGIEDDSGFIEDVGAYDHEPYAAPAGEDAQ